MRDTKNKRFIEFADFGYGLIPLKITEEFDGCRTIQDAYDKELKIAKEYGYPKRFKIFEIEPNKLEIESFDEAFDWYKHEVLDYPLTNKTDDKVVNKLYEIIQDNETQVRNLENKIKELQTIVDNFSTIMSSLDE